MLLKNGYVLNEAFCFELKDLCFSSQIGEKGGSETLDVTDCYVLPVLVLNHDLTIRHVFYKGRQIV